jgi:hypothetical protein
VEKHVFDVARFVEMLEALGEAFDMVFRKNEAMIGRLPGNSFVFVEFEKGGGIFKVAALALDAEVGDEAVGIDDIKIDTGLIVGRIGGAGEHFSLQERDAVETPGGVGDLLDEQRLLRDSRKTEGGASKLLADLTVRAAPFALGGSGGLVFVEEAAAMCVERCMVFGGEHCGSGCQAMAQGVERRTPLAGVSAGTGGIL